MTLTLGQPVRVLGFPGRERGYVIDLDPPEVIGPGFVFVSDAPPGAELSQWAMWLKVENVTVIGKDGRE